MSIALIQPGNGKAITALDRAVRRLVRAEISNAWKGAGHPDDIPETERELKVAEKRYQEALARLRK